MRRQQDTQPEFMYELPAANPLTDEYFARYGAISDLLDRHPKIVGRVHRDLGKPLGRTRRRGPQGATCRFTSEVVLRILVVRVLENLSLRRAVVRIDDSPRLRAFTRIYNQRMMDFTTLCMLENAIRPDTWKAINRMLGEAAVGEGRITGDRLRIDTTAVETNIHWPTDSSLLWDVYRTVARIVGRIRKRAPTLFSDKRLHAKRAKKIHTRIARLSGRTTTAAAQRKRLYERLIGHVEGVLAWLPACVERVRREFGSTALVQGGALAGLLDQLEHYRSLGLRVAEQARRRVLQGESVPNDEKIFSIFEPHTELLKRGKAGKAIEFGHMVSIQQVDGAFITDYGVFEKRPTDHTLVDPALESHERLFGSLPDVFTADKGFWENAEKTEKLSERVRCVSIGKKGRRTEEERAREHSSEFRHAQRFRAGVEGSISFLKRCLGLWRCLKKGLEHYMSAVGETVFAHNLLVLSRSPG
jgi:IS5 family transposase